MYAIKKLISPSLKVIKRQQDLQLKREKVLLNFYKLAGLIHLENFIQLKLSILGGV
jgi:hypothetical protein